MANKPNLADSIDALVARMDTHMQEETANIGMFAMSLDAHMQAEAPEAMDAREGRSYFNEIRHRQRVATERRIRQHITAVCGERIKKTREVCDCKRYETKPHYKVIVRANGSDCGPPMCPISVGLWRAVADMRAGKMPDPQLIVKLLEEAKIG